MSINSIYIVSQKVDWSSYVSSQSLDNALMLKGIISSSHWWDGFLITCIPDTAEQTVCDYLLETNRLAVMRVAQNTAEYHSFTKQYWENIDLKDNGSALAKHDSQITNPAQDGRRSAQV